MYACVWVMMAVSTPKMEGKEQGHREEGKRVSKDVVLISTHTHTYILFTLLLERSPWKHCFLILILC